VRLLTPERRTSSRESMVVGAARVWRGRKVRDHRGSIARRNSAGAKSSAMPALEMAGI
jgi:hypothetical protein